MNVRAHMLPGIVDHAFGDIEGMHFGEVAGNVLSQASSAAADLYTALAIDAVEPPAPHEFFPVAAAGLVKIGIRPGSGPIPFSPGLGNYAEERVFLAPSLPLLVRFRRAPRDIPRERGLHPNPPRLED